MDIISMLALVSVIIPAASYAWGMRGTTIGGEKGAMLPGAIIGAILARFSGIMIVEENYLVFAALGAVGMYFGGCMTYGETLSFSISAWPAVNLRKGLLALLFKGFMWFCVFGAVFSTGINAICGIYEPIQLTLLVLLTPVLSVLMLKKLNRPCNSNQVIFPKIYFSKTRKESWGALLGIIMSFLIINITALNAYSIIFTLLCGIFGGVAWVIGQSVYIFIRYKAHKSSLKAIHFLSEQSGIDGWKAMECTFGGIAGLGCGISFILTYNLFKNIVFNLEINGGLISVNKSLSSVLLIIWIILLFADMSHYFIKKPEYNKLFEAIEFILYGAYPFIMIATGSETTSRITAIFLLFWVIVQEIAFEEKINSNYSSVLKAVLSSIGILLLTISITQENIPFTILILLYTVVYEILTLLWLVPDVIHNNKEKKTISLLTENTISSYFKCFIKNKGIIVTHTYFLITFIIIFLFI